MAGDLSEMTSQWSDKIRNIVQIFKHGKREQVLILIGVLCLAAANMNAAVESFLPKANLDDWAIILRWFNVVSIIPFAWAIMLIWKKAVPVKVETIEAIKPSAIKGPFAFAEQDGKIFSQLGRETDISKLLSWVLDPQICFIALKGESGAGKTSLLRAGLVYSLLQEKDKYGITPIYWEAKSTDCAADLLHVIQSACPEEKENLQSLKDVLDFDTGTRKLIIIDQAEQLTPERNADLFNLFIEISQRTPPFPATWIIAFREEYASIWFDFEGSLPDYHPPKYSLKIFTEQQALEIMSVLAKEGSLSPDTSVLKDMVQAMSVQGRVSPVEIGIVMMAMSEWCGRPGGDVSLGRFRDAGGVSGLLQAYIQGKFDDQFPIHEHSAMEKVLLALIDPNNPNQRFADGKSFEELANIAQLPLNHLQHHLLYLASQTVRILEKLQLGDQTKYRLAHEQLIPPLESLAGEMLAAADQANRLLHDRYRTWDRARQPRFLLSGRELRQVLKQYRHIQEKITVEMRRFIRTSRNRRNRFIAAGMAGLILLMSLPSLYNQFIKPLQRTQQIKKRMKELRGQFVKVPAGVFQMGNPYKSVLGKELDNSIKENDDSVELLGAGDYSEDEFPLHSVSLSSFEISQYEITNQQYCDFLNSSATAQDSVHFWLDLESGYCRIMRNDGYFSVQNDWENYPIVTVSWYGAVAFGKWFGARLPTEAEWEYAANEAAASPHYVYSGSNSIDEVGWYFDNSYYKIHPVGQKKPNALNIYDMSGNVWEWCSDWYSGSYYAECELQGIVENPIGPSEGSGRVVRGGSWGSIAQFCRSAYRGDGTPGDRDYILGFRLVFVPQ